MKMLSNTEVELNKELLVEKSAYHNLNVLSLGKIPINAYPPKRLFFSTEAQFFLNFRS